MASLPRPIDQWLTVPAPADVRRAVRSDGPALVIEGWRTPLTGLPARRRVGRAKLDVSHYRGVYTMENVGGFAAYVTPSMPITEIKRRDQRGQWNTWMVDDPLHWYGMKERVDALPGGYVLCAGLGLGLMLWHLVARPDVSRIEVVEIDADVISLMLPLIPGDERISIVHGDYYERIDALAAAATAPDAVLWDLAVGGPEVTREDLTKGKVLTKLAFPDTPLVRFGTRRVDAE